MSCGDSPLNQWSDIGSRINHAISPGANSSNFLPVWNTPQTIANTLQNDKVFEFIDCILGRQREKSP